MRKTCYNNRCTLKCSNETYPLETCIDFKSGGSTSFRCLGNEVEETIYYMPKCGGAPKVVREPLNKCLESFFSYYENICS